MTFRERYSKKDVKHYGVPGMKWGVRKAEDEKKKISVRKTQSKKQETESEPNKNRKIKNWWTATDKEISDLEKKYKVPPKSLATMSKKEREEFLDSPYVTPEGKAQLHITNRSLLEMSKRAYTNSKEHIDKSLKKRRENLVKDVQTLDKYKKRKVSQDKMDKIKQKIANAYSPDGRYYDYRLYRPEFWR